ncbi:hypothetical protein FOMG_17150 [Fusarium oxysporum f. sp. melonis 26406]|uniref:C2H2-type domain-containing protein n=1 Tax=Fusarium oxysporum f. sp. melonis 26406 TaxID=1089452 RepID=W9ZDA3_FUSOX|nr:hypothetical protein FOMG_17150 [Fusarium oxysporum f. sp. melonis 26406]
MTASNLQSEPYSAIYPYVLLSTYRLLVCQVCGFASIVDEVATHLRTRHRDIQPERRQELVEKIKQIPNIIHSRGDLRHYLQYPTDIIQPIPYLAPPKPDGLKCRACGHILRRVQKIQKHYSEKHHWINPRGRGRPAPNCPASAYELPWEEHVACQRFFPSREGSKWFQVDIGIKEQANRPGAKSSSKKPQGTLQALTSEASIHLQQVIERDTQYREALSQPRATANDAGTNTFPATSLWLDRTQWPSIYRDSRRDVLRALTRLPDRHSLDNDYILAQGTLDGAQDLISPRKDERKVTFIMKALDSVINRCEDTVRATSHHLLCWLLSSSLQSRRELAFKLVVERSSEIRYRRTQKQFLAFVLRIYRMTDDSRREMVNVKMKPDIITQLDCIWGHSIWNYVDLTKGTWPVMERQGNPLAGTCSSVIGGQFIRGSLNNRPCQESDAEDGTEDGETDDENVEAWELDDDEDDEDGESDYDDSGHYNGFDEYAAGTRQDISSGISGDSAASAFDQFLELLFQLCVTLSTESYLDGQPSSTLLIYFSGILGFSSDCQRFQLARQYCSKLSAMIYIQRILFLERALPLREYKSIGIPQRPDIGQFECFDQVRAKYMVLGSQYPLAELISLRDFGRNIARTEPPSMLFHWSNDSETVSHATFQIAMSNFRKLADHFTIQAEALCDQLMFGVHPHVDLSKIKDNISSSESGYSFISCPGNGLDSAYLDLVVRAYTAGKNGLAKDGVWKWHAVTAYLKQVRKIEEQLSGGLYTACGQTPRIRELFSLEYENGLNTTCGVHVWGGYMAYIICHHKAKRLTNREFYVVRFLPVRLGHVLFKYLVYIRRLADLLRREQLGADKRGWQCLQTRLLFHNNGRPWPTSHMTDVITKATLEVWRQKINVRTYRQLAIAVTEKHVREVYTPFNRHDDRSDGADINTIFAWQSGHRPLQRGITYGLDGAYPSRLQPSLLRCYEWASVRWHEFLRQPSKTLPFKPEGTPIGPTSFPFNRKRIMTEVTAGHISPMDEAYLTKRQKGSGPLTTMSKEDVQSIPADDWQDKQDLILPITCNEALPQDVRSRSKYSEVTDGVLHVLDKPRILLCLLCRRAVQPGRGIENHFRNTHKYTGDKLKGMLSFCDKQAFQDPTNVPLPENGSKAIPQLPKLGGFSCDYCDFLSIDKSNLRRHCSSCKPSSQ